MKSNTSKEPEEGAVAFEQALEQLVLESYSEGVPVEGTWDVTVPVLDAPNWRVSIEKTYSEKSSSYQPTLLDE